MKKVLLVTFSDNADHQDITFGMFESLYKCREQVCDPWVMAIKTPKVPIKVTAHAMMVDCPTRPGINKKTFDLPTLNRIIRWIKKQKFNAIFFETLHTWNLPIMLKCQKSVKIYQMIHDLIPHEGDKQAKFVDLMNKAVCNLADYIVLCNKKYVPKVTEMYKVPQARVKYVELWRRFPEYNQPRNTKRVLFFGRLNPYKGINNLLEIAKLCPKVQFDVVGRVDPQVAETVEQLKKLPNITMNNEYVSDQDMETAFVNADWIVLPYNSATQSGVVIDGYRYGRPVIAFDVGAIAEQVADAESGYLIEAGNIEAFAEKVREAVEMDKEQYAIFSRKAYDFGYRKYAAEGATDRFLELFC